MRVTSPVGSVTVSNPPSPADKTNRQGLVKLYASGLPYGTEPPSEEVFFFLQVLTIIQAKLENLL